MDNRLWKYLAYGYLIVNTLSIMVIVEVILYKVPYLTLFVAILASTIYFNKGRFKIKREF